MAGAMDLLSGVGVSGAADRLSSKRAPTGKLGSPVLTIQLRKQFSAVREERDVSWEEWLAEQGYAIGDNENVYRKDE